MSLSPDFLSRKHREVFITLLGNFIVFAVYVFLISVGTLNKWPTNSTYYDQLARSFKNGSLALEQSPAPELLALPNPYDPSSRAGIPYPQDASLYKGRFYLYFGPIPGILLALVKMFYLGEIGDQYLVFIFALGLLLIQSLLSIKIMRRFFSDLPPWLILPGILVAGLISPLGWMMSLGSVYNASILGGQFFLFAGFYVAFCAIDSPSLNRSKLVLAGVLWVLAIGSRMTQILPVGLLFAMTILWVINKNRHQLISAGNFRTILSIAIPMLIGAISLGWYNWARFDSALEFGTTYQLAGPNLQKNQGKLFSPLYIPNNIYNYFLNQPEIKRKFPFLGPVAGHNEPIIASIQIPEIYFSQETAGLFFIAPFTLWLIPYAVGILYHKRKGMLENKDNLFYWVFFSLLGSFLISLLFYLFFFWAGVRYQAEFISTLTVICIIGFWHGYQSLAQNKFLKIPYSLIGLTLIAITIVNSNLVALSINSSRYRELNPELWNHLTRFFSRLLQ